MYYICTGHQPFAPQEKLSKQFNFVHKLIDYSESKTFAEMIDFISKLLVQDPEMRMSAIEALQHPWLNAP